MKEFLKPTKLKIGITTIIFVTIVIFQILFPIGNFCNLGDVPDFICRDELGRQLKNPYIEKIPLTCSYSCTQAGYYEALFFDVALIRLLLPFVLTYISICAIFQVRKTSKRR